MEEADDQMVNPSNSKPRVAEGDVIGVPLRTGGWALGVIARVSMKAGIAVGYFFGPKLDTIPTLREFEFLAGRLLMVERFGVLGIELGEWPVLGSVKNWNRSDWSLPVFQRISPYDPNVAIEVVYDDHDPSLLISETEGVVDNSRPAHRLAGYGAVEIRLTDRLSEDEVELD